MSKLLAIFVIFEVKEAVEVIEAVEAVEVILPDGANEATEVVRFTYELEFNNQMARNILFCCFEDMIFFC